MVKLLLLLCRLVLRIFFRRIEIVGREHLPEGKVMFALNHPNGLIDPLFILCYAPRPVSFLAKAPLFTMPVVGYFVRSFRCLPVYRQQDNNDPRQNRVMMQRAVELLAEGSALALFPEGTSHSDPRLKPFRSGAARIALSAAALSGDVVRIVPVGLYYSRKAVFRSSALLVFGPPLAVSAAKAHDHFEPPREEVQELTHRLAEQVGALTLQARSDEAIDLAKLAERIIAAANRDEGLTGPRSMAEQLDLRQQLVEGHARIENRLEVAPLVARLRAYETRVRELDLRVDQVFEYPPLAVLRYVVRVFVILVVLLLPGCIGLVVHYATYRLIGWLAFRYAKSDIDVLATGKVVMGLLLFPVTWILAGVAVGIGHTVWLGAAVTALLPLTAYSALLLVELVSDSMVQGRALWLFLTRRALVEKLVEGRRAIRDEVLALAALLERRSLEGQSPTAGPAA